MIRSKLGAISLHANLFQTEINNIFVFIVKLPIISVLCLSFKVLIFQEIFQEIILLICEAALPPPQSFGEQVIRLLHLPGAVHCIIYCIVLSAVLHFFIAL